MPTGARARRRTRRCLTCSSASRRLGASSPFFAAWKRCCATFSRHLSLRLRSWSTCVACCRVWMRASGRGWRRWTRRRCASSPWPRARSSSHASRCCALKAHWPCASCSRRRCLTCAISPRSSARTRHATGSPPARKRCCSSSACAARRAPTAPCPPRATRLWAALMARRMWLQASPLASRRAARTRTRSFRPGRAARPAPGHRRRRRRARAAVSRGARLWRRLAW